MKTKLTDKITLTDTYDGPEKTTVTKLTHGFMLPIAIEAPDNIIVDGYDHYDPKDKNNLYLNQRIGIRETKAPKGYELDKTIHVIEITNEPYIKDGNVYCHTKITFDGKILYDEISRWVSSEDPDGFSGTEYPDETKKGIQGETVKFRDSDMMVATITNKKVAEEVKPEEERETLSIQVKVKPNQPVAERAEPMETGVEPVTILMPASALLGGIYIMTRKKR